MRTFIIAFILIALGACQDDNAPAISPFTGAWLYENPDVPIEISFEMISQLGGTLMYTNHRVAHPAIPEDQQFLNNLIIYDEFENGEGFGRIEITARGTTYYKVILIYNRFTEDGNLFVYDVQLRLPGEDLIVLPDQVFKRVDNL